ncbi:MAG: polysaccharide biosynthesis protein, partial [Spirochaetaceae bacterium]|nr:polysaccharide biosynthesis protein [Spirochaetaceae bacterium]
RFGNVLGSRGSIMPLFKEQIFSGGPVTVTHPDAKRWFMTIPEAVSLVIKTTGLSADDGLYMLDMGEPVRIVDFARQMIRFYGYDEDSIPITFIGMRPGEKKTERLWSEDEKPQDTEHPRIVKVIFPSGVKKTVLEIIGELEPVIRLNPALPELFRNRHALRRIINRYFPDVTGPENEPEY